MTMVRAGKTALVATVALFFTLVVFNNTTDFNSNYQFVRHVLMMDSTFPGNRGMWRAIDAVWVHLVFYVGIIAWEALNAVLCWWGAVVMLRALRGTEIQFAAAKRIGSVAMVAGMLQWFVAFIAIGGEWFLMWQSKIWNGQDAAFRMFVCEGIVLVVLLLPE
jgi:predicted small integral membrane protein